MLAPRNTCTLADSILANHAHAGVQAVSTHVTDAAFAHKKAEAAARDPGAWFGLRGTFRRDAQRACDYGHRSFLIGQTRTGQILCLNVLTGQVRRLERYRFALVFPWILGLGWDASGQLLVYP